MKTHNAVEKRRLAMQERTARPAPIEQLAAQWDREADALLQLPQPLVLGTGGEVAVDERLNNPRRGLLRETLGEDATVVAVDASLRRLDLLHQSHLEVVPEALDMADSVDAVNSLEKALAHQLAALHNVAMRQLDRALRYQVRDDAAANQEATRCLNAAARLLSSFNDAALTLQRLRGGSEQRVHVEHVHVGAGGQAIVGNVSAGGTKVRRGAKSK